MNDIAKTNMKDRLLEALKKEGLSKTEAGERLGIKPQYLSMMLSPSQWNKFPESTWDTIQKWVNSDQTIVVYSEKHGKVLPEKLEIPKPLVTVKPEALERRKKELAEIKQEPKRATVGEMVDMLIKEKKLLQQKIDAIDVLLKHYIS